MTKKSIGLLLGLTAVAYGNSYTENASSSSINRMKREK